MKFSNIDVIYKEQQLISNRKEFANAGMFSRIYNRILNPPNPKYTFSFYVPEYIFIRSSSFCEDVEEDLGISFTVSDLARVLYIDFLEYMKRSNDIHSVNARLKARSLTPTKILPYSTEDIHEGVIFEEHRGFEIVETRIEHKYALKGEFFLMDMLEIYKEHDFILENILEIVFCDFINDYRRFLIKNPIGKIAQYIE